MRILLISAILPLILCGCADSRMKGAAAVFNAKTQTAAQEYQDAKTPEAKDAIATEYFQTAPKFAQLFDDWAHGRAPAQPAPTPAK